MEEKENKSCSSSCSKSSCEGCPSHSKENKNPGIGKEPLNKMSSIKHVIGVISGKGGVGKSFVTGSLANAMAKAGYKVGILDGDITGPSIPRMYGIYGKAVADDNGVYPIETSNGIKLMSINLLLPNEETPVIWRGPVIASTLKQFWTDVVWGDLDYLFIDMPPGTGDVPLTAFQSFPLDGVVVVTTPQDLVKMIVKKAYNMATMMQVPVLGVVENYSFVKCPDCGKEIKVFGDSKIDEIAAELNLPVLGKMPIDQDLAMDADKGLFSIIDNQYIKKGAEAIEKLNK